MPDLIIDVGANVGAFVLEIAARNPDIQVIAIEPIPQLSQQIQELAHARTLGNVRVRQLAIDASQRMAAFHVADHGYGVSSLLEFDRDQIARDDYWKERDDLRFTRSIEVSVARLDSLPEVAVAGRIRFIKIDAQGLDVQVLESLGGFLDRVDAGMLEVPATMESRLYAQEADDLHSALTRLAALGFHVYAIKPNDHASNEMNLFFCRRGLDPKAVEQALRLRGIEMYDGKHFWHFPSDILTPDSDIGEARLLIKKLARAEAALTQERAETERLGNAIARLDEALARECAETRRLGESIAELDAALTRERVETMRLNEAILLRRLRSTQR